MPPARCGTCRSGRAPKGAPGPVRVGARSERLGPSAAPAQPGPNASRHERCLEAAREGFELLGGMGGVRTGVFEVFEGVFEGVLEGVFEGYLVEFEGVFEGS